MTTTEKLTRRNFIGSMAALGAVTAVGAVPHKENEKDWFTDITVDKYYDIQGGQYGDTGGVGLPGYEFGIQLTEDMYWWEECRELDDRLDVIAKRGFYLTPSTYFGEYKKFDRIYLTKRWMEEFYRRHKKDTPETWKKRYDDYVDGLVAQGWKVVNGRFGPPNRI